LKSLRQILVATAMMEQQRDETVEERRNAGKPNNYERSFVSTIDYFYHFYQNIVGCGAENEAVLICLLHAM
jgi:hypothetical protein